MQTNPIYQELLLCHKGESENMQGIQPKESEGENMQVMQSKENSGSPGFMAIYLW